MNWKEFNVMFEQELFLDCLENSDNLNLEEFEGSKKFLFRETTKYRDFWTVDECLDISNQNINI